MKILGDSMQRIRSTLAALGNKLRSMPRRNRLLLVCGLLLTATSCLWIGASTADVFGRGRITFVSPDGLVNQDSKKPTSFGDADDLQELVPPPQLVPGTSIVTGHITDALTGATYRQRERRRKPG